MNAYCQIRHGNYIIDLGYIAIKDAKNLANEEAKETKRTMVLWFFNNPLGKWEALSVHHPSGMKSALIERKEANNA